MVRLRPGFSVQPVRASGCAGFCAAATQMVWVTRLTNVTRWAPAAAGAGAGAPAGEAAAGESDAFAGVAAGRAAGPAEERADGVAVTALTAARTSAAGAWPVSDAALAAVRAAACPGAACLAPAVPPGDEQAVTSATTGPAAATSAAIRSARLFFRPAIMGPVLLAQDVLGRTPAARPALGDAHATGR